MHIWRQMQYLFDNLKDTCINYHLIACKYMHVYLPLTVIETPDQMSKQNLLESRMVVREQFFGGLVFKYYDK